MQTKTKTIIIIVIILIATAGFGIYLFQKNKLVIPDPSSQNIEQSAAEESQQQEPQKTDFGTSTPAFVTIQSTTVEGIVTEIISSESLVRIYDPERNVVYSITVPSNTLPADKGGNSISIGDRIIAVSTTTQDAFEFHADSVTIVSRQADQFPISPSVQKISL